MSNGVFCWREGSGMTPLGEVKAILSRILRVGEDEICIDRFQLQHWPMQCGGVINDLCVDFYVSVENFYRIVSIDFREVPEIVEVRAEGERRISMNIKWRDGYGFGVDNGPDSETYHENMPGMTLDEFNAYTDRLIREVQADE